MTPKAHRDIQSYIDSIPYGTVSFDVERVNRKTVKITTKGTETLRYEDTDQAITDLNAIIRNLTSVGYSGHATVELDYKDGQIKLVGIHDEKVTQY